jgi:hypothetical protein
MWVLGCGLHPHAYTFRDVRVVELLVIGNDHNAIGFGQALCPAQSHSVGCSKIVGAKVQQKNGRLKVVLRAPAGQ